MPVCKYCGARITKFDNDMCPVCGTKKPLEGVTSETIEVTSEIDIKNPDFKLYKPTKRVVVLIFFSLLGVFGAGFFYAKYKKYGLIWLAANLVFIGGLGSILAFLTPLPILWGYLIPTIACYLINIGFGLFFFLKPSIKDANGEFIR